MNKESGIAELRGRYHREICRQILGLRSGTLSNADRSSHTSQSLANGLLEQLGYPLCQDPPRGQTAGKIFTDLTKSYLDDAFSLLNHLVPGKWLFSTSQARLGIAAFDQYEHLEALQEAVEKLPKRLAAALGGDYLVTPDIIVARKPLPDSEINAHIPVLQEQTPLAAFTPLREANTLRSTLHASVSCKWTIRSDRVQNTRTEALNLMRNRKGKTPHIVAVTAEPMPTRLASLGLGTGDIDCIYHMALPELREATQASKNDDQMEMLQTLTEGRRLRDISDLPFDLAT